MRPQRKIMMVETTHAFVKLKQIKAAVSAGGINSTIASIWLHALHDGRVYLVAQQLRDISDHHLPAALRRIRNIVLVLVLFDGVGIYLS